MFNVIGAAPLMGGGQFQPYVSGGVGWVTLNLDTLPGDDVAQDDEQIGGNVAFSTWSCAVAVTAAQAGC